MATPYDAEIEIGKPSEIGLLAAQAGYRRCQEDYASLLDAADVIVSLVDDIENDWDRMQVWIEREDYDVLHRAVKDARL